MSQDFRFDPSRSLTTLEQDSTIIAVIEMSQTKWLVAAVVPGVERQPLKKLDADKEALLKLLQRWRNEANRAGREIKRIVVAYEAGPRRLLAGALAQGARYRGPDHPRIERSRIARAPARQVQGRIIRQIASLRVAFLRYSLAASRQNRHI